MKTSEVLTEWAQLTERAGIAASWVGPSGEVVGTPPGEEQARIVFHSMAAVHALGRRDHLAIGEAFMGGEIDIHGDLTEVLRLIDEVELAPSFWVRAGLAMRLLFGQRLRQDRASIAFHYDRPAEFFLPWLDRLRCYSHGLYADEHESLERAVERKMQTAIDALALRPGDRVLDMGGGWGCFVEYAGRQGIEVHAITISDAQFDYVSELIRTQELPCSIEKVNFRVYQPDRPFAGAVFMGTFEHNPEYARAARFLQRHLEPGGRVWADFCAQRRDFTIGRFMKRYLWPGPITYVNPYGLVEAFIREGFNVHELSDDTLSYAWTIRDWGDSFEAHASELADRFGEPTIRAFRLFLRGSLHFLRSNQTQAYHVVFGRDPRPLSGGG
ncbi:MAG: methyltransferase domain-containing protein [bacterium]|nr:methyltransferase domain-containing protein [bacterium]MCP5066793.1 methyltransferase domain-containing protein [bacterium]